MMPCDELVGQREQGVAAGREPPPGVPLAAPPAHGRRRGECVDLHGQREVGGPQDLHGWSYAGVGVCKITVQDGRRSCGTLLADLDFHPCVELVAHATS